MISTISPEITPARIDCFNSCWTFSCPSSTSFFIITTIFRYFPYQCLPSEKMEKRTGRTKQTQCSALNNLLAFLPSFSGLVKAHPIRSTVFVRISSLIIVIFPIAKWANIIIINFFKIIFSTYRTFNHDQPSLSHFFI